MKKLNEIFKNINYVDNQYPEGYFIRSSTFEKGKKNKPNIPYDFSLIVCYCKCCDVIKSISFTKHNKTYSWNSEFQPNPVCDFILDSGYEFEVVDYERIIEIVENI